MLYNVDHGYHRLPRQYFAHDLTRRCASDSVEKLAAADEALIDIRTLAVIRGSLPRRALALVREWATLHHNELMEDWRLCEANQTLRKISPLQ